VLLLSHKTVMPDGRLLNVTKSVTHPDCPERTDGVIRMEVGVAGMLCFPAAARPGACEILQIGGGDPKGSIPKAVINFGPLLPSHTSRNIMHPHTTGTAALTRLPHLHTHTHRYPPTRYGHGHGHDTPTFTMHAWSEGPGC
jgi:hypothetical protein